MSRDSHPVRDYIDRTFAPEDALLQRVREAGEARRPGMQISAGEGKLLYLLCKLIGAKQVLEIGCFMGYSAICMARALPDDGELITLEADTDYAAMAQQHFDAANLPIRLMVGTAQESLSAITGSFDVVFVDADKKAYADYLETILPLVRSGGLIIGDNSLLFGAMIGEKANTSNAAIEAMQQFNTRMANDPQLEGVMIPTDEGLTVARKL